MKRKYHTHPCVRRTVSSRWRAARHYGENKKVDPLKPTKLRMKKGTIYRRKHEFYSTGHGATGIKISRRRVESKLRQVSETLRAELSELVQITGVKNALGKDTGGRWSLSDSYVRYIQAALDAYLVRLTDDTYKIARKRRLPEDGKRGIKWTKADLLTALSLRGRNA